MEGVAVGVAVVSVAKRRVGAHLSIVGGSYRAVERIVEMGGNCLQIFSSSPRMWVSSLPKDEDVNKFKSLCQEGDVRPVFIHAKYLINLGSDKQELIEKSVKSLEFDLKVAEMIGARGVIVHLGSHMGRGFSSIEKQLVGLIKRLLKPSNGRAELIIENSAGQQGKIASQLSEIRLLIEAVSSKRLTWCLDTCHAWAAGFYSGKSPVNSLIGNDIVKQAEELGILDKLVCLHVNDSRDDFGSGRDRHDNLGQGKMGKEVLAAFVNHAKLNHLPMIIETPGFDRTGPDKKNLDILKSLVD